MTRLAALWATLMLGAAASAASAQEPSTAKNTDTDSPIQRLAELRLDERLVPARMINLPIPGRTRTLQDVLDQLDTWARDDTIGTVLLDVGNIRLGLADVEELRDAIEDFRGAGKRVSAFLNGTGPAGYLLACAADEIVIAPSGGVAIPGLGAMLTFMKGYYQRLGYEFEVITAGRYKYPGFLNARAPNAHFEEEYNFILDGLFASYKDIIARGRKLSAERVGDAVDTAAFDADEAQQRGLVDRVAYYDEYVDRLLNVRKLKKHKSRDRGLSQVNSIQDFMELINREMQKAEKARQAVGPKIAVLHARGPIIDVSLGAGMASQVISRDDFVKVVDELRRNKSIKAVVLRVDSPGGSAYASDIIWRALRRLDEAKPLVVSMGTVAGSGGYYIACPGRRIFAQPTTITGSIGVLSIFQCTWSFFNRMDYDVAEMSRGARSLLGAPHRELSGADRAFIVERIQDVYDQFIDRVARTRKIPAEKVREIAEGRIYTGQQALDLGLVDALGGLSDAVEAAREMAAIPASAELKILHYPRPSSLGELFESLSSVGMTRAMDILAQAAAPAPGVGFHDQLMLFAQQPRPLCWMAVPNVFNIGSLYEPAGMPWPGAGAPAALPPGFTGGGVSGW